MTSQTPLLFLLLLTGLPFGLASDASDGASDQLTNVIQSGIPTGDKVAIGVGVVFLFGLLGAFTHCVKKRQKAKDAEKAGA
ncbi:hypothetical protein FB45DRAFT_1058380 [Roridomyces roridus]|uniref:Uncharacterized protein n=1 Tax=Roridomyces roridus TaxID=1738132 RepID=A0AAD7FDQ7_9AGAR|nr:hypothetical protein FB45DRAFT_933006 [Roridomyces roridus]KAJ7630362.1 hypothetical protein FB45DRAFT_1058380 [Roridomyces roridus]